MTSCSRFSTEVVKDSTVFLGSNISCNFSKTIIVDQSGNGQFRTIQDAIYTVPNRNNEWIHILVKPGTYVEKVHITEKTYIFLEGSGPIGQSKTKILWEDKSEPYYSLTFNVFACKNLVAKNIAFMNSYNEENKTYKSERTVAATITGDQIVFYNCGFYGLNWTLNDSWGTHYYSSCYIEGANNVIWGTGTSIFEGCTINVIAGQSKVTGSITAQGQSVLKHKTGFVFTKGSIIGTGKVFLGRAYGSYSRVIFSEMTFNSVVHPKGWDAGAFVGKEYILTNVEASCKGPGARTSQRAKWTKIKKANSRDMRQFTKENFIDKDNWIAKTRF